VKHATSYQFRVNELVNDKNVGTRDRVGFVLSDLGFDCRQRQDVLLISKTPRPTLELTTSSSVGNSGSFSEGTWTEA
jgi:hypothetical protein